MDWNAKWDWENIVAFGSKASESPKKLQLVDWMIVDDGEIDAGSFNPSMCGGGNNSGGAASGSDGGHVSSTKSSISASTDSSTKDVMQSSNFRLMNFEGFPENFSNKIEMKETEVSGTYPVLEASVGSVEPLIGLKLGKRTYFENSGAGGNVKSVSSSSSVVPNTSTSLLKKTKSPGQNLPAPRCAVDGCNADLSTAKDYHRKHRVCDGHSKCAKVIVGGLERRFCQQCSRFHNLSEFDERKRSCRRRLSDHNARRRKPQQETIQFNSTRLSSSFYGGRQQTGFLLNNGPLIQSGNAANTTWGNTCNSKFTLTKGYPFISNGNGVSEEQMHMPGIKLPHATNMHGSKGSHISSHLDAAMEYRRALSLLSTNSWSSCGQESMPLHNHNNNNNNNNPMMHENETFVTQPMMHTIPEGIPLSAGSEFWLSTAGHQSTHHHRTNSNNYDEIQLSVTPYEPDFYSNILN
ncbi:hypothetical protein ABFS82_11G072200 [Erythranthe guttata]